MLNVSEYISPREKTTKLSSTMTHTAKLCNLAPQLHSLNLAVLPQDRVEVEVAIRMQVEALALLALLVLEVMGCTFAEFIEVVLVDAHVEVVVVI